MTLKKVILSAYEHYDLRKVGYLYENREELFVKLFKKVKEDELQAIITKTTNFLEKVLKCDGKIKVDYTYSLIPKPSG